MFSKLPLKFYFGRLVRQAPALVAELIDLGFDALEFGLQRCIQAVELCIHASNHGPHAGNEKHYHQQRDLCLKIMSAPTRRG